jgi:hypothetical protein
MRSLLSQPQLHDVDYDENINKERMVELSKSKVIVMAKCNAILQKPQGSGFILEYKKCNVDSKYIRLDESDGIMKAVCGKHMKCKEFVTKCNECAICLEEKKSPFDCITLPCKHTFHKTCIEKQFRQSINYDCSSFCYNDEIKCALCRRPTSYFGVSSQHILNLLLNKYKNKKMQHC